MDSDSFLTIKKNSGFPASNLISESNIQEQYSSSIDKSRLSKRAAIILPNLDYLPIGSKKQSDIGIDKIYLEQALLCFEEQKWAKAITVCQEALAKHKDLAEAYKIWGNCLYKLNRLSEAVEQYIKALEIKPDMEEIYANIGSIFSKKKEWNKAINYYLQALRINPHSAGVYYNLARLWEELGDLERAEEYLFKGIELNPRRLNAQQHFQLAEQLSEEGKVQLATICYRHAIALNPGFVEAYVKLIEILESNGNYDESIEYYPQILTLIGQERDTEAKVQSLNRIRRLLASPVQKISRSKTNSPVKILKPAGKIPPQLQPSLTSVTEKKADTSAMKKQQINEDLSLVHYQTSYPAEIQFNLGCLLANKQQWQLAIKHCRQAITLKPSFIDPYIQLAKIYRQLGETKLSYKILFKAYNINPSNISAPRHFKLGHCLLEHNEIAKAAVCFQQTINLKPDFTLAYWKLAEIVHDQGNLKQAIAYYQRAIIQDRHNVTSYLKLGRLLETHQKWEEAVKCYQHIIKLDPSNYEAHHFLGSISAKTKQWQEAVAYYRQAIELNPDYPDSYYALAETFAQTEQWDDAQTAYNKAFILNPNLPGIRDKIKLANSHRQQQQSKATDLEKPLVVEQKTDEKASKLDSLVLNSDQATESHLEHPAPDKDFQLTSLEPEEKIEQEEDRELEKLKQAIKLEPENSWNYHHLAQALSKREKLDEAIAQFYRAIELEPEASWNYHAIAKALSKQNKLEEAISLCHKFIELEPKHIWGYFDLGEILLRLERWSEATEAYLCAYNLESNEIVFSERLANTFSRLGAPYKDEAVKYYRQAINLAPTYIELYHRLIELEPENPEFNLMLANLLFERNEWDAAIVFYQTVLQFDPNCSEAYFHLGELYQKQQQWEQAIDFYKTAVELEPKQANYHYQLGEALEQRGSLLEAISHYQKAIELEPKLAQAHQSLGDAFMKQEAWTEALAAYKMAQKLDPESAIIYKNMGDILAKQNKIAAASQAYLCAVKQGFQLF